MPTFVRDDVSIYYEEHGSGFPLLLIAPGGMRSTIDAWSNGPWDPIEHLRSSYRVITMDQRNAGRSTAPIRASDSWHVYTEDQMALMDHLGAEGFHVAGMCIGGPYCMGLIEAAPERVASAVLFQTIGLSDNRQAFFDMFDSWADDLKTSRDDVDPAAWEAFKQAMYGGDFLLNVSRDFVAACQTPLLVLCGKDLYHPEVTSREIAELAPLAQFIEHWKEPEYQAAAQGAVLEFLATNTPA
jgi:pimeloyl-ACP methyl ester carboxylesterase